MDQLSPQPKRKATRRAPGVLSYAGRAACASSAPKVRPTRTGVYRLPWPAFSFSRFAFSSASFSDLKDEVELHLQIFAGLNGELPQVRRSLMR